MARTWSPGLSKQQRSLGKKCLTFPTSPWEGRGQRGQVWGEPASRSALGSLAPQLSPLVPSDSASNLGPRHPWLPWSAGFEGCGLRNTTRAKADHRWRPALGLTAPTLCSVQALAWPPVCAGRSQASSPVPSPSRRTWLCSWKPWTSSLTC